MEKVRKKILAIALCVICLSLVMAGTVAYYTASDTAHNVITSGGVDITLQEWADKAKTVPFPKNGVNNVMPGAEITKIAEVKNTGSSDAFVRVAVKKSITLAKGVKGDPDPGLLHIELNRSAWKDGGDGYYYYMKVLAPGKTTEPLFASVTFDHNMDNIYQNSTAAVDVTAYAVQTANNGSDAFSAEGWPKA